MRKKELGWIGLGVDDGNGPHSRPAVASDVAVEGKPSRVPSGGRMAAIFGIDNDPLGRPSVPTPDTDPTIKPRDGNPLGWDS